jgi:hypothetical protein
MKWRILLSQAFRIWKPLIDAQNSQGNMMKLVRSGQYSHGVADIHGVESMDGRPSMVHYDINLPGMWQCVDGPSSMTLILAKFCGGTQTKETCGFPNACEPWW